MCNKKIEETLKNLIADRINYVKETLLGNNTANSS